MSLCPCDIKLDSFFIHSLEAVKWRSIHSGKFFFSPGINVIKGRNGSGKTNILEALSTICMGKSFRQAHYVDMISIGAENFYLRMHCEKEQCSHTVLLSGSALERQFLFNGQKTTNRSFLFPIVVWSSEDFSLCTGSPAIRRKFLDDTLLIMNPLYGHHLRRYYAALLQRNKLLKKKLLSDIESWDQIFVRSGGYIWHARQKLLEKFSNEVSSMGMSLLYTPEKKYLFSSLEGAESKLKEALVNSQNLERRYCITLCGPHRDDVIIEHRGHVMRNFASRGESFLKALSLKQVQWNLLTLKGVSPVILVDEFGLGLDNNAICEVLTFLKSVQQTIVTLTPERVDILEKDSSTVIDMEKV